MPLLLVHVDVAVIIHVVALRILRWVHSVVGVVLGLLVVSGLVVVLSLLLGELLLGHELGHVDARLVADIGETGAGGLGKDGQEREQDGDSATVYVVPKGRVVGLEPSYS